MLDEKLFSASSSHTQDLIQDVTVVGPLSNTDHNIKRLEVLEGSKVPASEGNAGLKEGRFQDAEEASSKGLKAKVRKLPKNLRAEREPGSQAVSKAVKWQHWVVL